MHLLGLLKKTMHSIRVRISNKTLKQIEKAMNRTGSRSREEWLRRAINRQIKEDL